MKIIPIIFFIIKISASLFPKIGIFIKESAFLNFKISFQESVSYFNKVLGIIFILESPNSNVIILSQIKQQTG